METMSIWLSYYSSPFHIGSGQRPSLQRHGVVPEANKGSLGTQKGPWLRGSMEPQARFHRDLEHRYSTSWTILSQSLGFALSSVTKWKEKEDCTSQELWWKKNEPSSISLILNFQIHLQMSLWDYLLGGFVTSIKSDCFILYALKRLCITAWSHFPTFPNLNFSERCCLLSRIWIPGDEFQATISWAPQHKSPEM